LQKFVNKQQVSWKFIFKFFVNTPNNLSMIQLNFNAKEQKKYYFNAKKRF